MSELALIVLFSRAARGFEGFDSISGTIRFTNNNIVNLETFKMAVSNIEDFLSFCQKVKCNGNKDLFMV